MKIIIPMSGIGKRFVDAGYKEPKPLIIVEGKPIIEHIVNLFSVNDEFIFICNNLHLKETNMREVLEKIVPNCKIYEVYVNNRKGPVHAVMQIVDEIKDDDEIIISYCDYGTVWNYLKFKNEIKKYNLDGCIACYKGFHPHMLNGDNYAFIKDDDKNFIEIHAFEPNINIISYLERNFIVNKVSNFFIHKVAIGPQSTSLSFFVPENHSGNGRISSQNSNMQVMCINRDYLNKVFTQSVESYFIKIDVEGSESDVLNELFNSNMSLLIKYIFIEINTRFSDEDMLINILQGNGFYEKIRRGSEVSYDALYVR
jgi:FkbM family methyltransferase